MIKGRLLVYPLVIDLYQLAIRRKFNRVLCEFILTKLEYSGFCFFVGFLHTPQVPPSLLQCLHPSQDLQVEHEELPLHPLPPEYIGNVNVKLKMKTIRRNNFI